MENFGQWLRSKRKALGLLQSDVAKRAGVSTSYISTLERNQKHSITGVTLTPEKEKVIAIAKAVQADPAEALHLCGYASDVTTKPRTVPELLAAIERLGVDQIMFPGGVESLQELSEDDLNDILESVRDVIEAQLIRKTRNRV